MTVAFDPVTLPDRFRFMHIIIFLLVLFRDAITPCGWVWSEGVLRSGGVRTRYQGDCRLMEDVPRRAA